VSRLLTTRWLRFALPVMVALGVGAGVWAYFTSTGKGTAGATVGAFEAPSITSATAGAGTVALSWSTVTPPTGSDPVTYYVARDGGTAGGNCPTVASPTGVTNCTDSGLSAGTYHYTVTAKWHSWTAASGSRTVTVASGAATHLAFDVQPSSTTAGAAITPAVTVRVLDANNNLVTTDSSTKVTLAIGTNPGGGTLTGGGETTVSGGTATFGSLSINKTGTGYTLTASDTTGAGGIHPLTGDTSSTFNIVKGTKTATTSGNWCNAATWSPNGVPVIGDDVTITGTGTTITIQSGCAAVASSVTLGNTTTANTDTLTFIDATSSLTTDGDVNVVAPNGTATRDVQVNAGAMTVGGNLNLSTGATSDTATNIDKVTITTGSVTVSGNLVFNAANRAAPNVANSQLVMSGGAGTFNLVGAFTINGTTPAGTLTSGTTSTFNFNGTTAQTIPIGVSSVAYNNLAVSNTSGATLSAAITATNVKGNLSVASASTLNNGGFAITLASAKNFSVANTGTFNTTAATTSAMVAVSGGGTKTFGATSTVNYGGSAQTVTNEAYGNLTLSGSGIKTMPNTAMTIAGNFTTSSTATASAAAAVTVAGDVTIGNGTSYTAAAFPHSIGGNFTNNGTFTTSGASVVTFNGTGAQSIGGTTTTTFQGLTINKGSGTATLTQNENVTGALTVSAGTLDLAAQTMTVTGASTISAGATVNQGAGTWNAAGLVTVGGTLNEIGGTLFSASGITVNSGGSMAVSSGLVHLSVAPSTTTPTDAIINNGTITLSGGIDVKDFSGTGTVSQSGGTFRLYHDYKATGAYTATAGTFRVSGAAGGAGWPTTTGALQFFDVLLDVDPVFDGNAALSMSVAGNWTANLATNMSNKATTVNFNGSGAQTIGGSAATIFNNVTISNSSGVSLSSVDATVGTTGVLALGGNVLSTGSNKMIVSNTAAGAVTRSAGGFVNGKLQRAFASGASTVVFDVGSGTTYAPISISVTGANANGTLIGSTTGTKQPNYSTSGLNQTQYVNRYWTLTAGSPALTVTAYNATFTFVAGDLVGTPNTAALLVKKFISPNWTSPTSGSSSTGTTVTGTGFGTTFGDYAAGN
jgi:hypothetical protein